jgi:hypothetical protein
LLPRAAGHVDGVKAANLSVTDRYGAPYFAAAIV